ncbi:3-deoxy-7-phosphoheptulonate synthase [bacterium]|nr:3-deoxy-7-phosphoheptulonate synthase [bacterium]
MLKPTYNLRVREVVKLQSPNVIKAEMPMTEVSNETVVQGRSTIEAILDRKDPRLLVVIGPCSIHDAEAALEYAERLNRIRQEVEDRLFIVMRVYFEKPRTTVGWKGLINDPHLDGSYDIDSGLKKARQLLLDITGMGLPTATEFLDPIVPQYIADLVSWAAIGARTTESQTHREMASGLSMPVGYKNATDGSLQIALDAMSSARTPHNFLGIDQDGATCVIRTAGNPSGHVVLRGGRKMTNYDAASINAALAELKKAGLPETVMVDCSHANSAKQHKKQEEVWNNVIAQRADGNTGITGMMVESFLCEGNQPFPQPVDQLKHGVSITDACIGWEMTERLLRDGHKRLAGVAEVQTAKA